MVHGLGICFASHEANCHLRFLADDCLCPALFLALTKNFELCRIEREFSFPFSLLVGFVSPVEDASHWLNIEKSAEIMQEHCFQRTVLA